MSLLPVAVYRAIKALPGGKRHKVRAFATVIAVDSCIAAYRAIKALWHYDCHAVAPAPVLLLRES